MRKLFLVCALVVSILASMGGVSAYYDTTGGNISFPYNYAAQRGTIVDIKS